jgi:hypothetical protein
MHYIQRGSGQRGHGLGSALVKFLRFVKPYAISAGKSVGKSLLKSGVGLAKDVIVKKGAVGEALKRRASEVGEDLTNKLETKVRKMTGGRRRRKRTKRLTPKRKRVSSTLGGVRRRGRRRRVKFPIGAGKKRRRNVRRRTVKRRRRKQDLFTAYSNK